MVVALLTDMNDPDTIHHDPETFGRGLRRIRLARLKTQAQMAADLSVDRRTYAAWELGEHSPRLGAQARIDALLTKEERAWFTRFLSDE